MATFTDGHLDDLRRRLRSEHIGSIEVRDVFVERRFDAEGVEYVQVTLVVSEPRAGQQTWPVNDAFELRQRVRWTAAEVGIPVDVSITITSAGEADTQDDEEDDDAGGQDPGTGVHW